MSTVSNFPSQRPNVRDMIHRFRYGKPTSRSDRGTGTIDSGSLWGKFASVRDGPTVARLPPLPVTFSDILDPFFDETESKSTPPGANATAPEHLHEFDRLKWAKTIPASFQPTPASEPVFSLPEVMLLHKSLEVEPVTAPDAPASAPAGAVRPPSTSESPLPPDTEETLDQMIENLDVTLTRLNWRLNAMRRSAPAVFDTVEHANSAESSNVHVPQPAPKPVESSLLDSFFVSDDEADHAPKPMPRSVIDSVPVAPIAAMPPPASVSEPQALIRVLPLRQSLSSCVLDHTTIVPERVASPVPSPSVPSTSNLGVEPVTAASNPVYGVPPIAPIDAEWQALQDKQREILERLNGIRPPPIPPPDHPVVFPYIAPEGTKPPIVLSTEIARPPPPIAPPATVPVTPITPIYMPRLPPQLPTQAVASTPRLPPQAITSEAQQVMSHLMSFQAARAAVASKFGV